MKIALEIIINRTFNVITHNIEVVVVEVYQY